MLQLVILMMVMFVKCLTTERRWVVLMLLWEIHCSPASVITEIASKSIVSFQENFDGLTLNFPVLFLKIVWAKVNNKVGKIAMTL